MKRKQYEASRTKKTLLDKKRRGEKFVIWKISSESQYEEIERLGFIIEPWIYEIKTRHFFNIRALPSLLKDIHFANQRGKSVIVRRLKKSDEILLKEYDIRFQPIKYRINLVSSRK